MRVTPTTWALALVAVAAALVATSEGVGVSRQTADLDDMLGTSPMSEMVKSIDERVRSEEQQAEKSIDAEMEVPMSSQVDADIEKAAELREHRGDIGEGNELGLSSRASVKAKILQTLKEAGAALSKARGVPDGKVHSRAPNGKIRKTPKAAHMPKKVAPVAVHPTLEQAQEDPIDAMKSAISAEIHQTTLLNTAPRAEDPLDQAIDRISSVRAQAKAKRGVQAKTQSTKPESAVMLLEEFESVVPGAGVTGETGQTIPPSSNAPPGPPNPPVKEATAVVPDAVPLSRQSPDAPSDGVSLDAALASEKGAPSTTGPADAPPPKDGKFAQSEIDKEMKAIDAYPISRDEAINEAVKNLVPWHKRPDAPKKPKQKGPPMPKATPAPAPPPARL